MPKISEYANGNPPVDTDEFISARAGANKKFTWANIKATLKTYLDTASDGWTPITGTFAYASASTITISAGGAAKYAVDDRLKWITATGSTQRYGVVATVADTLLTVAVNTDHVLANEAWTLPYYSHQASPVGFPQWFNCATTLSQGASTDISKTTTLSKFMIQGRQLTYKWVLTATGSGTAGSQIQLLIPVAATFVSAFPCGTGVYYDAGSNLWYELNIYLTSATQMAFSAVYQTGTASGYLGQGINFAVANTDDLKGQIILEI